jgi:hypothetical protein
MLEKNKVMRRQCNEGSGEEDLREGLDGRGRLWHAVRPAVGGWKELISSVVATLLFFVISGMGSGVITNVLKKQNQLLMISKNAIH